jgi:hypothetical protein
MVSAHILSAIAGACCIVTTAAAQSPTSEYTSTAEKQCKLLEEEEQGAAFKMLCHGYAPYELIHEGYDGRSWISLRYRGRDIDLHESTMHFARWGAFPAKTNNVVEWRGVSRGREFVPYALIYRISRADPMTGRDHNGLLVVRLAGEQSRAIAYVNAAEGDVKARKIADEDHFHERR